VKFDFLFVVFVSGFWALNFEVELTPYPSLFFQLIAKADLLFSVVSVMDSFMFLFLKNNGVRKLELSCVCCYHCDHGFIIRRHKTQWERTFNNLNIILMDNKSVSVFLFIRYHHWPES
jgi:hypothetical protein